jgi:hypothetical protein
MGGNTNLPFHFYVNVDNKFLGPNMPSGVTPAIWHAVYSREYQTLMCHVLLESGAHWSGLPLHAISTKNDFSLDGKSLMPWASMGEEVEAFYSKFLEGLSCNVHKPITVKGRHTGIIIDWKDGYSRYPSEHKPLSLIELENGQFALLPNNFVTYTDNHFTKQEAKGNLKYYKRGEVVYWEESHTSNGT